MFDFLKKEKEEENIIEINNPIDGKIIDLSEVPDPVFAQGLIGVGFAVCPENGVITSPLDGEIILLPEGKHAVAIKSKEGIEILIHIGIDTVNLKSEGFKTYINLGDEVKKGDKILEFDMEVLNKKIKENIINSKITPVVITNPERLKDIKIDYKANQNEICLSAEIVY